MSKEYTIAFYNVENLFDPINDPSTDDNDFLPNSRKRWTAKRYTHKLYKLSKAIASIGQTDDPPVIVGLAEVENKKVLKDLVSQKELKPFQYSFIHFNSPDERGIDVALLYQKKSVAITSAEPYAVDLTDDHGVKDYSRDILKIALRLADEQIHILVNHWSSRREGAEETEYKRVVAAQKVNGITTQITENYPNAKIIVMGDFNDNPHSKSIQILENGSQLYNPFETVWTPSKGSLNYKFKWLMFDQILLSHNFLDINQTGLKFRNADVANDAELSQYHGKFKGQPFRTYVGKKYFGGYSDHFPVYVRLYA